jgi:acetyl esterase/lipase
MRVLRELPFKQVDDLELKLDLYLPDPGSQRRRPLPVVLWVPGGGWSQMGRGGCGQRAAWLADEGLAVAGIEYRASEQARFPAQIRDCKTAVRWLRAHAGKYGLDARHVGAWGDSAGGHLVQLLGSTTGVAEFEEPGIDPDRGSEVQAVCALYGPSDLTDLPAGRALLRQLLGVDPARDPERVTWASPLYYANEDSAPHLLAHGDADRSVPISHSYRLLNRLQQCGVPASLYVLKDVGHDANAFYAYEPLRQRISAFFAYHLLGGSGGPWES